jgi:2-isopropylmalate synthase
LSTIDEARAIVEQRNELPVHPRHPYVGELVYTAFSGSHQDAIKKGMHAQERSGADQWDVTYIPIDPNDLGRSYEAIIRVNSQSGKGGVAYLMEVDHHLDLPRGLQVDFAQRVQAIADARGGELTSGELMETFQESYLDHVSPLELVSHAHSSEGGADRIAANLLVGGEARIVEGEGNGPIDALVNALARGLGVEMHDLDYYEHAMGRGEDATAAAYVEADVSGEVVGGVGIHPSIVTASLRAVVNAGNRAASLRAAHGALAAAFDAANGSA